MTPTGFLFDLQRTSLHDGPGIRTAVFFKGCPLRCLWCHNPESQARGREISFRPEVCAACGECVVACEHGAHHLRTATSGDVGLHEFDRSKCERCGKCVEACLYEALKASGEERTVESVLAEVRRDRAFYEQSGGGMTLTGGEPLLQLEFTLALLEAARAEGIHTCLETCGWASRRAFEQVLPLVDLFLFDYKATDPEAHRRLTGVSNERILENLDFLYRQGAAIRLRCPLVAGVNDTPEHLAGIAALDRRYPRLEGIDLLAYHNTGNAKYERYAIANPLPGVGTTTETESARWLDEIRKAGGTRVRPG
jgi:pyruvate formate lyase activating enzyme